MAIGSFIYYSNDSVNGVEPTHEYQWAGRMELAFDDNFDSFISISPQS